MTALKTVLQIVLINETGDSYHRMRWPGLHLAVQDPALRIISLDANAKERLIWGEEADLLILYQCLDHNLLPLIKKRRALGRKTLVEYNDNFYDPPACSPVASAWASPLIWQIYESFMEHADGVIVTGPGLKELFSSKTKTEIHILENHYPYELRPMEEIWKEPKDVFHLGWAGSVGHMGDLLALLPTIYQIMERYPQVVFNVMGTESIPSFVHLPKDRLRFSPWGSMNDYFAFWKNVHLGIAPLLDSPYNQCRSDIKAVEMTSQGALPLISDLLPYRKFLNATGLKPFSSFDQCRERLVEYIQDPQKMKGDFLKSYEYVKDTRIGSKAPERLNLYKELLPKECSKYAWPYPAGYHEVSGTNSPSPDIAELTSAQNLVNQGKIEEARLILKRLSVGNPYHADYRLSELKCLMRIKDASIASKTLDALRDFPKDLRFVLLHLMQEQDIEAKQLSWNALLARLKKEHSAYRTFFMHDLLKLFFQDLRSYPSFAHLTPNILLLYPNSATLRYEAAMAYEKVGKYKEALAHFEWLEKMQLVAHHNKEFFGANESSYFSTWVEALRARISGT